MTHTADDVIEERWSDGFPTKTGWYDCLYEGQECRLLLRYCAMKGKFSWCFPDKTEIHEGVQWKGQASQFA